MVVTGSACTHEAEGVDLLAVGAALVLPQFFLPPAGRVAFGIAYAAAAALLAVTAQRAGSRGGAGAPFVPAVEVRA
ncbi:hypothetical protein ACTHQ1_07995 [Janibacter anophelis]|uniref:hypothetical protein n=1 Tax=Janibacter anophelis TaxID=319054 RepID=UPI003F7FC9C7